MGESNMNQKEAVPSVFEHFEHLGLISTWWRGKWAGGFSSSGRFPLTSENKNDGFLSACGGCKMVHSLEVVALSTVWVAWEVTESSSVWTSEVEISASGHTSSYSHCTVQFLKYLFMKKWKHCKTNLIYQSTPHNGSHVEWVSSRCSICVLICACLYLWSVPFCWKRLLIHCLIEGDVSLIGSYLSVLLCVVTVCGLRLRGCVCT